MTISHDNSFLNPELCDKIQLRNEAPDDLERVEELHAQCFGPGRFARTAFRLRESKIPDYENSWVCELEGELVGAVRITQIKIGKKHARLLGPLCTLPNLKNMGIGRTLMQHALEMCFENGIEAVLLVGDYSYYGKFGFEKLALEQIRFPGPVDPERLLLWVRSGKRADWQGAVR